MSSESVKDLGAFQGNDLYKHRVLHDNILLSYCNVQVGLPQGAAYAAFAS